MRGEKDLFKLDNMLKSLNYADLGGGVAPRILLAAALLGSSPVCAQELAPVVLENNGLYSLTPVDKQGENTITKFEYNDAFGEFVPVYYRVDLNKTDLGHPDVADSVNYYKYTETDGVLGLTNGAADDYDISYSVDSSRVAEEALSWGNLTSDIDKDFINANYVNGAIQNTRENRINSITGDFVGNSGALISNGGGMDKNTSIGSIKGNFINNSGIVIRNQGGIDSVEGNFIGNTGTLFNNTYKGKINKIKGNFIGNTGGVVEQYSPYTDGAVIQGLGVTTIGSITGNFIGNSKTTVNNRIDYAAAGAAISNGNTIGQVFDNDKSIIDGDIYYIKTTLVNPKNGEKLSAYYAELIDNHSPITSAQLQEGIAAGRTIIRREVTQEFTGTDEEWAEMKDYLENNIESFQPQEIPNANIVTTEKVLANLPQQAPVYDSLFIGNHVKSEKGDALGGAIYNNGLIGYKYVINNSNTPEDETYTSTYLDIDIDKVYDSLQSLPSSIENSSFYYNYAESVSGEAKGGAIYSTTDISISADNGQSVFSGNKVINNGVEESNAIYMDNKVTDSRDSSNYSIYHINASPTLTLSAENNGLIYFDDKIDGTSESGGTYKLINNGQEKEWLTENTTDYYDVKLTGDGTGTIVLNNDVKNADITLEKTNLYLGKDDAFNQSQSFSLDSGSLNMINGAAGTMEIPEFNLRGDVDMMVDVDLANSAMDRITADSYGDLNGNLNVVGMNLISDATEDRTEILFADTNLKDHVTYGGNAEIPDDFQTTAYTPIHQYDVSYDNKEDGGYFIFQGSGISSGKPSDNFNPAVLSTTVANQAAGQSALNEVFKYSYEHLDTFTKLPEFERDAIIESNKYAMSTDFNNNMSSGIDYVNNKGVWFKPFTTFENIDLKNGPKVDAITYGTLVGFDTDFKELGKGWNSVFSGFAGYVGSSLNYSGVDSTMNGGLLGFTETFYKGNFWTAISATAGASVGESHNMYGKEDYTSLLAGVSSKTGYNFEFKNGKFIVQPIMYLGYTFVNTFDYKNSAGVNIDSDPLHTIQLNPSVRFIANLKNGWQPYASVGMVWNLMNESKATANNVRLPEMSVKPYVEYGVGVQRNWADKYTGYLQAMVRNGGRTGVALTGGFRFMLGDETKVTPETPKKDIKSL